MNFKYKKINTVIFDVGGVLAGFPEYRFFTDKGYSEETARKLVRLCFENPFWTEGDRGTLTRKEFVDSLASLNPGYEELIHEAFSDFSHIVRKKDTSIPWIKSLKARGYRVYVLSNYSEYAYLARGDELDFEPYTDGCFWSYQHKMIKPEPEIFEAFLDEFKLDPLEAVFVEDTLKNLEAAANFGIRGVHYLFQSQAEGDLNKILEEGK